LEFTTVAMIYRGDKHLKTPFSINLSGNNSVKEAEYLFALNYLSRNAF
jgi:hypothetical protein